MLKFTKMQGLGNDFIIIDGINQTIQIEQIAIAQLADRHLGIGFDQLLLIEKPIHEDADFLYRIFNADGSESYQCGNGVRCVARYVYEKDLIHKKQFILETKINKHQAILEEDGVYVNMQVPIFNPKDIPFIANDVGFLHELATPIGNLPVCVLSMGNPHCVMIVDDILNADVEHIGACVSKHPNFPEQTNVEFMKIETPNYIDLRIFERGVGETKACGSGACAAAVAGRVQNLLDEQVIVAMPGGELQISWKGLNDPVWMKGPAVTVFEGEIVI